VTSMIGLTFVPLARFSGCLLSNCSRCSLLKALRPNRFPHRVTVGPGVSPSSCFCDRWGQKFPEWSMLLHPVFLISCCRSLLSFRREPTPPQCPIPHFTQSNGSSVYLLRDLQLYGLPEDSAECALLPQTYLLLSFSISYSTLAFRFRPTSLPERPSFLGSWYNFVLALTPTTVSLRPCRNCTAGRPSADGGQLLPGPTTALVPYLQLSAVLCS
jgi:hypothetical protein